MRKTILSLLAVMFTLPVAAQQEKLRFTLEDCLDYAMGYGYTRQSKVLDEEAYEVTLDQSKLERLPNLSASGSESLSHTKDSSVSYNGSYSVNAGVTLYQGGAINKTIEQNKLYLEKSQVETAQYDNELTISILECFLTILKNEELMKYQRSVIEASEEQLSQGRAQFAVGAIIESDYLLLESQLASDKNNLFESEANLENNLLSLKSLLSMDISTPLDIIAPDTTVIEGMSDIPSETYVITRTKETLPDLEILQYAVDIAHSQLKLARANQYPTLSASGSIGTGHSQNFKGYGSQLSDNFNQQAGVSLSIPIFSRGQTRANINRTKIALRQAELSQKQSELDIIRTVVQEWRNVHTALNAYRSASIKENAYRANFSTSRVQFNLGAITTVDLLQQQNNYISALNEYIQSKYSFMLQRKILDVYTGERIKM